MTQSEGDSGDRIVFDNSIDPLTFHELHSAVLGVGLGFFTGIEGRTDIALALALGAYGAPIPMKGTVGVKTAVLEPWYFIAPLMIGHAIGVVFNRII